MNPPTVNTNTLSPSPSGLISTHASKSKKKKVLGDFVIGKTIGQGAFSKVKLGFHRETGTKVAIKVINKVLMAQKSEKSKQKHAKKGIIKYEDPNAGIPSYLCQIQLEVQLLMRLDHPNIIKLYQMIETKEECYVIMEYAPGGELINYIASKGRLSENEARKFFRQLISAIDHCHLASVVHRDLKLENLLLSNSRDLLLSDFGLGRTFADNELLKTFCGTPNYAAAELVSGIPYAGNKSDIWAMGVVLYVMVTGHPPFRGDTIGALYNKIKSVEYYCPPFFSDELKDLLAKILVKDPNQRIDMDQLRRDPWVCQEQSGPPNRVIPKTMGADSKTAPAKAISSITGSEETTCYTFRTINNILTPSKDSAVVMTSPNGGSMQRKHSIANVLVIDKQNNIRRLSAPMPLFNGVIGAPSILVNAPSISENISGVAARRLSRVMYPSRGSSFHPISETASISSSNGSGSNDTGSRPLTAQTFNSTGRRRTMTANMIRPSSLRLPDNYQLKASHESGIKDDFSFSAEKGKSRARAMSVYDPRPKSAIMPPASPREDLIISKINSKEYDDPDPFICTEPEEMELLNKLERLSATSAAIARSPSQQITDSEIIEWHRIHRPAKEIRTIKWIFNAKTTSNLPSSVIFQHIHNSLIQLQKQFNNNLSYTRVEDFYMMYCEYKEPEQNEPLLFEIEIVKVWLMKLYGVKVKRISGDAMAYKELYTQFVDLLKL